MALLYYSTNMFLKWHIVHTFGGGTHYVWCSENFDSTKLGHYHIGAHAPPSSDPYAIFKAAHGAIDRKDTHDAKIEQQRKSLTSLAGNWATNGNITDAERDDIVYMVANAQLSDWRPLLYVIPAAPVTGRVETVAAKDRASPLVPEFIIRDLKESEFHVLEF